MRPRRTSPDQMRLLFVTDSLMMGGIETQLVDLVTRLDRRRFDLHVACLYGPHARELHFTRAFHEAGIPVYCFDRDWGVYDKGRIVQQLSALAHKVQPHIIQAENYHANLLTGFIQPFHRATRFIGTQRGVYTPRQLAYTRIVQRWYDHYIVSAPHLREQLVTTAKLSSTKVDVILNGIDVKRFAAPRDATLRQRLAPGIERLLISMGRISSQKRMHLIAEGMGILKQRQALTADVQLWIVGPVQDPALYQQLLATIQHYQASDQIKLYPTTDYPEDFYAACDATILYSVDESLPCVMLESLAAGRPVLISDEANAAGTITDGQTGWIAPTHDTRAFADVLSKALTLPRADDERMRALCVKRAESFDVAAMVDQYVEQYMRLLSTVD